MKHFSTTLNLFLVVFCIWAIGISVTISTSALAVTPVTVPITAYLLLNDSRPHHPFPQHVQYVPGTICPDYLPRIQQDNDVRAAYDLLNIVS